MNEAIIYAKADHAGRIAARSQHQQLEPKHQVSREIAVTFRGDSSFSRYLKKMRLARPNYPSGMKMVLTNKLYQDQSQRWAYALAFARSLRDQGIDAYAVIWRNQYLEEDVT